ncbi:MAG: hypothetical protein AB7F98_06325 [Novosphingobium sp.]
MYRLPMGNRLTAFAKHPAGQFVLLLVLALIWRCDTFGDPSLHGDETFYWTVGLAMHDGALPYIDIWDRKPFGLFALYYLIAGLSPGPMAYQIAAALAAAGAAWAICTMALRHAGLQGALLAGAAYLLWLGPLQGYGGQSPVFYNLFIALAALIVLRALPALEQGKAPRTVALAMLLAGLGITIKTTALFEAAFLGLYATAILARSGADLRRVAGMAVGWAAIGAAPSLAIAGGYWLGGHWAEYWHAMVTSNLAKPSDFLTSWIRLRIMFLFLAPLAVLAAFGWLETKRQDRRFLAMWLIAAFVSLLAVANFYIHYAMPLTIPLCLAAAPFLARGSAGRIGIAMLAAMSFFIAQPFQFTHTREARAAMQNLAATVRAHDAGRGLLTFEAPAQLYTYAHKSFMTPLVFPTHLSALIEKDVSHLSTAAEMRRALAAKPGVVVIAQPIHNGPVNAETQGMVESYVRSQCRMIGMRKVMERTQDIDLAVWGDCKS